MKFNLNFHKGNLQGWVATEDLNTKIKVQNSIGLEYVSTIGISRPSVVEQGITTNPNSGFTFKDILKESLDGNFYTITIVSGEQQVIRTKFFGDVIKWRDAFERFQIEDRKDFSCQNEVITSVFEQHPDLIAFKILMIRLRRGKRAYKWRGTFKGHEYPHIKEDWAFFKRFYIKNFDFITEILTVRSIWSIVDTFVDFGEPLEKACGLAISNYMYQERFAQTARTVFKLLPLENVLQNQQVPYWGAMYTNRLSSDDAYDVFITKNIEILDYSPILKKIFAVIQ